VVVQELPVRELIEHLLAVTGKDAPRIRELLRRGALVSGGTRFRWEGWEADGESVDEVLTTFPDAEPSRPFAAERCVRAILRGGRAPLEIPREVGARKGLFQRAGFWGALMEVVCAGQAVYAGYSYRDRVDRYLREFSLEEAAKIRAASDAVRFSTLRDQIGTAAFSQAELHVTR